jgi:hypothetical protein
MTEHPRGFKDRGQNGAQISKVVCNRGRTIERHSLVFDHSGQSYILREVQSTKLDVDVPVTK